MAKAQPKFDAPDGPAKITVGVVQTRGLSKVAGAPKGWRKLSPLQSAFEKGHLGNGDPRYSAEERFDAGSRYSTFWDTSQASGRNILDLDRVFGSGNGGTLSEAQQAALKWIASVDWHLGRADRTIIRMVCGEGHWPSEAVATISPKYKFATLARFREALDALIEAMETARRSGYRILHVTS